MIVSVKDSFKFLGVTIVCFCAVFVCTFFMNYYLDVVPLKESVSEEIMPLYNAQLATAKFTTAITGGFLAVVAVIMLLFYIKLYIDANRRAIGIFKAMGYSDPRIASNFLIMGLCVLLGCVLGFAMGWAFMPLIYKGLTIEGLPAFKPTFHISIPLICVLAPTVLFTLISYGYVLLTLRKPVLSMIKGETVPKKVKRNASRKDRPFLKEMCFASLRSQKAQAFFIAFSCFCFSAMVQMGLSMEDLVEGTMGVLILAIGLVLAAVSMFMAMTTLVKRNSKNIAVMKAMGFCRKECFIAIFLCYVPIALLGFAIGTVYQFGLLYFMVNFIFKDVGDIPSYGFNVPVFFITLALFLVAYCAMFAYYLYKADRTDVKQLMSE